MTQKKNQVHKKQKLIRNVDKQYLSENRKYIFYAVFRKFFYTTYFKSQKVDLTNQYIIILLVHSLGDCAMNSSTELIKKDQSTYSETNKNLLFQMQNKRPEEAELC